MHKSQAEGKAVLTVSVAALRQDGSLRGYRSTHFITKRRRQLLIGPNKENLFAPLDIVDDYVYFRASPSSFCKGFERALAGETLDVKVNAPHEDADCLHLKPSRSGGVEVVAPCGEKVRLTKKEATALVEAIPTV